MLSRQEEERERRETLDNDLKVLQERGSTFHQHGVSQAAETSGGRFAATGAPRVVGSLPGVAAMYPAASAAHQTELPLEPPLNYSIDEMVPLEPSAAFLASAAAEQPGPALHGNAPSPDHADDELRPGAGPLSQKD